LVHSRGLALPWTLWGGSLGLPGCALGLGCGGAAA